MSTPEIKAYLLALQNQEEYSIDYIRRNLLATLSELRGTSKVKKAFEEAIKGVGSIQ